MNRPTSSTDSMRWGAGRVGARVVLVPVALVLALAPAQVAQANSPEPDSDASPRDFPHLDEEALRLLTGFRDGEAIVTSDGATIETQEDVSEYLSEHAEYRDDPAPTDASVGVWVCEFTTMSPHKSHGSPVMHAKSKIECSTSMSTQMVIRVQALGPDGSWYQWSERTHSSVYSSGYTRYSDSHSCGGIRGTFRNRTTYMIHWPNGELRNYQRNSPQKFVNC